MNELYELPNGWKIEKFDDIKISNVIGLVKNVKEQSPTLQYQYVKMNNITNDNGFTFDKIINVNATDEEVKKFSLKKGDFLFNTRNSAELVGKSCIFDYDLENILYNNNIMRVRFRDDIIPYFISYQFNSRYIKKQLKEIISATTNVAAIYYKTLKEIDILIPPFQEQKRIVSKLDTLFEKIDKAIALHQKNMDEADAFMGSVLNDVFGKLNGQYEKRTLESFNKKMSSGGTPSRKEKAYWENGTIDWFSSGELNQLYTLPAKEKITQLGLDKTSTKLFSKGTLLIGMYDTAAMKMSILSTDGSCNQAIVGFKPDENELNIFFTKYQLEYLKKEILEQRQGVRQQNLNLTKIKNIQIEYPPLNIQQKTVTYLDEISQKIEKIKSVQKEKMQSLVALKASILDQAFRGKL